MRTCSSAEGSEDGDDDLSLDIKIVERRLEGFDLRGEEVESGEVEAARVHGCFGEARTSVYC